MHTLAPRQALSPQPLTPPPPPVCFHAHAHAPQVSFALTYLWVVGLFAYAALLKRAR
jgi:hypothetical protein